MPLIERDLLGVLSEQNVHLDQIGDSTFAVRKEVEVEVISTLQRLGRIKKQILVDHDIKFLVHQTRCVQELNEFRMCVTWDKTLIDVSHRLGNCGLTLSPADAADFVQPSVRLTEAKLCTLAHGLARVSEKEYEARGRFVDKVVALAAQKMLEFQFKEKVKTFYDELFSKHDPELADYDSLIDKETIRFLDGEGVTFSVEDAAKLQ